MGHFLETLKSSYNPTNTSPASGNLVEQTPGPVVIATEDGIPFIHPNSLLPFDHLVIKGDSSVEEGVIIRRNSAIQDTKLGHHIVIMDYVTIEKGTEIAPYVLFAHSSHIEQNVTVKDRAFGNIQVHVGRDVTVSEGTYLAPGVTVPDGITTPPNVYVAQDPPTALSKAALDENWQLLPSGSADYPYARLVDVHDMGIRPNGMESTPAETLAPYVMTVGPRFNMDPNQRTGEVDGFEHPLTFADFEKLKDYHDWREALGVHVTQGTTSANWLDVFGPTMHHERQLHHNLHDAQLFGAIVWDNASRQAEILSLARAKHLIQDSALAESVELLIKAENYLLGAYTITPEEQDAVNEAYQNKTAILQNASRALREFAQNNQPAVIQAFPQETIESILLAQGELYLGQKRLKLTLHQEQIPKTRRRSAKLRRATTFREHPGAGGIQHEPVAYHLRTGRGQCMETLRESARYQYIDHSGSHTGAAL